MMNGSEEWRDIEGYEGIYQISDCGRVKSLERMVPWGKGIRHIKERNVFQTIKPTIAQKIIWQPILVRLRMQL